MSLLKIKTCLVIFGLILLAGCGGGGSAGTTLFPPSGGTSGVLPADLQIVLSPTSVDNSGTQSVRATVTAVDAAGKGLSGVAVTLSVDKGATFVLQGTNGSTTGSDGAIRADVSIGSDRTVRTITVTASAGPLTRQASYSVTGSLNLATDLILTLSSSQISNSLNSTVTATATAVDSNRNALSGIPVTLSVNEGATIVPSGSQTGNDGTIAGVIRIGSDQSNRRIEVKAVSGTVSRVAFLDVVGSKLTSPNVASSLATGQTAEITYLLVDGTGSKLPGYAIAVSAAGLPAATCTPSPCRTDSGGQFTYRFTAPATPGALTISAAAAGQTLVNTINVAGTVVIPAATLAVNSASVSSSPSVVSVNDTATSNNSVEIRALFVAENNAPVQNVRVWFDLAGDKNSIGGTLASTAARALLYSDANGVARTTYTPGSRYSPKDGVTIRVCWASADFSLPATDGGACANQALTTLTVVSESLSVSIGTNDVIGIGPSLLTYTKRYVVQVVDSAGRAKVGVTIAPSIDLLNYFKGSWIAPTGSARWIQGGFGNSYPDSSKPDTATAVFTSDNMAKCGNEDLNRNGVVEFFKDLVTNTVVSEDQNGSAALTPTRPALDPRKADVTITAPEGTVTNSSGIVVLQIEYPQNVGSWVEFNILVSASGVAGTEGRANFQGILPVPALAVNTVGASPAFQNSPYGTSGSETFKRQLVPLIDVWLCTNPH